MNIKFTALTAAVLSIIFTACGNGGHTDSHEGHNHSHEGHNHSREGHSHSHEGHNHDQGKEDSHEEHEDGVIVVSPEDAEFLGISTDSIFVAPFSDILHVSGQLESAPTDVFTAVSTSAGVVNLSNNLVMGANVQAGARLATVSARNIAGGDPNESAYIVMEAAKRELDRIAPLHADGIVSTRDYNAAEAEYQRAKASYSGAKSGSAVTSRITGIVTDVLVKDGEYVEAGTPIATISKGERLTVRADVPARSVTAISDKITGNIRFAGSDNVLSLSELNARRVSGRVASMKGAFVPVYFEIDNRGGNLVAGMVADIYLTGDGRDQVLSVPVGAVSEQQGVNFVYVKLDDDCYRKVPVVTGRNDGRRVEIKQGIEAGTPVVTEGMTFVKLAESNGAVPEGHTHNH